jgi:chromosomal replication initiation ATPase DnaA
MNASSVVDGLRVRDLLALVGDVCKRRGVTLDEVCGRTRSRAVCYARQEVWWRLRHHPERFYSYHDIARLFARDHATIIGGVAAHERRVAAASA